MLKLQKAANLTKEDHHKLDKHYIKLKTGLETMDLDIVKQFMHGASVLDFACLIDRDNDKNKNDLKYNERQKGLYYCETIINKLGYENIYSDSLIPSEEFNNNINSAIDFLINEYVTNKEFNMIMNKSTRNIRGMKAATMKAKLGYINSHLSIYSIKISAHQAREAGEKNKVNVHGLGILNNIDELFEYKMNKGYRLEDEIIFLLNHQNKKIITLSMISL